MVHVYMSVACTTNCNMNTLLAFSEIRFIARTLPKHIYITIGTNPTGSALHLHQYCHTRIPFSSFSNYITSLRMFFEVVDVMLPISNHYDLQVHYGSNQHSLLRWKNFLYEKIVKQRMQIFLSKVAAFSNSLRFPFTQPINFDDTPNSDCQFRQFHQQITDSFQDQYFFQKIFDWWF